MIKNSEPLSMAEALKYVNKGEGGGAEVVSFIKKFTKMKPEKAEELRKSLEGLELIKMNENHIVKIIDLLPKDKEELNKIFSDVGLDEDETKKLLDTIKQA